MRVRVILVVLILGLSSIPSTQARAPETLTDVGAVFGGVHVYANSSSNASLDFSSMPAIVEDYTATWCESCVRVEHALNDVEETNNMQQYHFHRFIGESEDPLGSQEGDDRWNDRYEERIPPTAIFNGTIRQIGSSPHGESLQDDYNSNLEKSLQLGAGTSMLTWVAGNGETSPSVSWNLVIDMANFPENSTIKSSIWVVEEMVYFPDGGNGEEYYPESVRAIIELGEELSGTKDITLPAAYDGDDLEIHLIHEVILPEPVEETPDENDTTVDEPIEDAGGLPSISLIAVLAITMIAAITVQRKQQ
tara:strand:+ start:1464 stop:2381 length:918 start_codon:yes stop_codon:yes gene_type:complete